MSDFGELLKRLRQSANLTQEQLGQKLHMSKSMICYYERSVRPPSSDVLMQIAEVFHVSVDYLLGREKKEQTIVLNGFSDKDVEFLKSVVLFLQGKNDELDQKNKGKQDQRKKEEQDQKKKEEQDLILIPDRK